MNRLPLAVRILLSFSLLVAAFLIWQGGAKQAIYAQWVMLGIFTSFIGDLIMARLIPLPNRLIGGMIAFGVTHTLYINAYVRTMQAISSADPFNRFNAALLVGLAGYGLIAVIAWLFLIRNPQTGFAINIGAVIYGLWISTMAAFALALAVALGGAFWLTALGGLLFVVSDLIIGVTEIRRKIVRNANGWIWVTYVAGQAGIVCASIT